MPANPPPPGPSIERAADAARAGWAPLLLLAFSLTCLLALSAGAPEPARAATLPVPSVAAQVGDPDRPRHRPRPVVQTLRPAPAHGLHDQDHDAAHRPRAPPRRPGRPVRGLGRRRRQHRRRAAAGGHDHLPPGDHRHDRPQRHGLRAGAGRRRRRQRGPLRRAHEPAREGLAPHPDAVHQRLGSSRRPEARDQCARPRDAGPARHARRGLPRVRHHQGGGRHLGRRQLPLHLQELDPSLSLGRGHQAGVHAPRQVLPRGRRPAGAAAAHQHDAARADAGAQHARQRRPAAVRLVALQAPRRRSERRRRRAEDAARRQRAHLRRRDVADGCRRAQAGRHLAHGLARAGPRRRAGPRHVRGHGDLSRRRGVARRGGPVRDVASGDSPALGATIAPGVAVPAGR